MRRSVAKPLICAAVMLFLALASGFARAEEPYPTPDVTADSMLADLALVRPLGIVATVLGTAAYIVALPFSLPTGSTSETGQMLVVAPFKYTFARPMGQFQGYETSRY